MKESVQILPYWRVVLFKGQYFIQLFQEKPDGADNYVTYTKSSKEPFREGDFLVVRFSDDKSIIIHLNDKEQIATPLFVADKYTINSKYVQIVRGSEMYYWEPELLTWGYEQKERCLLDCGQSMRTYVCKDGSNKAEKIHNAMIAVNFTDKKS